MVLLEMCMYLNVLQVMIQAIFIIFWLKLNIAYLIFGMGISDLNSVKTM